MKVSLFVTCLVDQLFPKVGKCTVNVLRRAGCDVDFDERQTCCGQPAFNSGYRREARKFAERFIEIFEGSEADAIVSPSGSCTAMVKHFHELFPDSEQWRQRADKISKKTHELGTFLVNELGVEDTGAAFKGRIGFHDACHGLRDLGIKTEPRKLLGSVHGAELVELSDSEVCCGFGGTFSVKYPEVSVTMVDRKIKTIEEADLRAVVSCDSSCLMQIGGRLSRNGSPVKTMHLAEILDSHE
ncbi:MAG TPA: (Fe-S)-binding protein [Pyrinomonadaceae bacterium]